MTKLIHRSLVTGASALALIVPGLAAAAVQPETNWYSMPRDVSQHGHRISWLIDITTLFAFILFVIMCTWMAIAYLKHTNGYEAEYDHGNAKKQVLKAGLLSSIIFLWIDGNLFYNSMKDVDTIFWDFDGAEEQGWHFSEEKEKVQHDGTLRIEINGHQWAWDARYAGPDGIFQTEDDIVTLNDIRVPENKTVYLQVASTDVIHGFALPNYRVQIDAMPGMINHLLVHTADNTEGQYEILCAQHCGAAHYLMKGIWTVHSQQDFDLWAAESSRRSALAYKETDTDSHWGWAWKE